MTGRGNMKSDGTEPYGRISLNGLQLIAKSRDIDVPAGVGRDEILMLLRAHDVQRPAPAKQKRTPTSAHEPTGWWTSLPVKELRTIVRDSGVAVPAGIHRRELVELLIEHDVREPLGQTPGRNRRSG